MSVVLLADVKRYVNFKTTDNDTDLQSTIDAAESIAAHWVGQLASTTVTQRFYNAGLSAVLQLDCRPVISVTSVTGSDGAAVPLANLDIDLTHGTIYPDTTGWINRFQLKRYTVVYQAGWVTVPGDIKLGIIEQTRILWQPRKGGGQRPGGEGMLPSDPAAYPLPRSVRAYWDPYIPLGLG